MEEKTVRDSPCRTCFRRHFNCHTMCREYKEFRKYRDKIIEERNKETAATPELPRKMQRYINKQKRWK